MFRSIFDPNFLAFRGPDGLLEALGASWVAGRPKAAGETNLLQVKSVIPRILAPKLAPQIAPKST